MKQAGRLAGKAALVTGAGSGIGRAIARRLAAEGARVTLVGRGRPPLEKVAAEIAAAGGTALVVNGDVANEADVKAVLDAAGRKWKRLDVVVNNAGVYEPVAALDTSPAAWDKTIAVNLRGPYLVARAAFPLLAASRGSVINVSSNVGTRPVPGAAAYCVSKAGLDMLTRALALEWAGRGVRVNALVLGIVDTPIHDRRKAADRRGWRKAVDRMHPLGRMGRTEDAAAAALYLASDEASWVTGALLVVDGGISLV